MSEPVVVASNNQHKLTEFRRILEPLGIEVLTPADLDLDLEVEETGATFAENAILKARAYAARSGMTAVADDSGIEVDALGGEPGVYSARYGGPGLSDADRTLLLLDRMREVPFERRSARFVAAIALLRPDAEPMVFEGRVEGKVAAAPLGSNGFGYDPVFYYPPFGCTFGEAAPHRKDRVSHRARALADMARYLRDTILEQPETKHHDAQNT